MFGEGVQNRSEESMEGLKLCTEQGELISEYRYYLNDARSGKLYRAGDHSVYFMGCYGGWIISRWTEEEILKLGNDFRPCDAEGNPLKTPPKQDEWVYLHQKNMLFYRFFNDQREYWSRGWHKDGVCSWPLKKFLEMGYVKITQQETFKKLGIEDKPVQVSVDVARQDRQDAVSYTHLTLPTILRV